MSATPDEQEPIEPARPLFDKLRVGLRASLARLRLATGVGRTPSIAGPGLEAWSFPILIAVLTVVAFLPTLQNGFVSWDDPANLLDNPNYRGLSWTHLSWMFTTLHIGHYQPLSWVTLGLDYLLWGMQPMGYHLTSLLLHAANGVVFYLIAARLLCLSGAAMPGTFALRAAAAVAALFFAVHPLRVESVAWATERRDVLSGLFLLGTVLSYLRAALAERNPTRWMALSVVLYSFSLLSKASGIALPIVLLALDIYPLRRLGGGPGKRPDMPQGLAFIERWFDRAARRVWLEKLPFVILAALFSVVAFVAQREAGALVSLEMHDLSSRVTQALFGLAFYLWKSIFPLGLSPLYAIPGDFSLWDGPFLRTGVLVLALTIAFFVARRRWPAGLASWVVYAAMVTPVLGIVQSGSQIVADRYSYLSCLGWAVLLAGASLRWWPERIGDFRARKGSIVAAGVAGLILLGLGTLTWKQTRIWHDSERLWRHAVAVTPSGWSHYHLGLVLADQGKLDEAAERFRETLSMNSSFLDAYYNLAKLLASRGELDEALGQLRRAMEIDPNDAGSHIGIGLVLAQRGELDDAIGYFRRAVELKPKEVSAHNNLGIALAKQGDLEGAIRHFQSALEIKPWDARTHRNLANALIQRGDLDGAAGHLRRILEGESEDAGAHMSFAMILAQQGDPEGAIPHFRRVLELNPGDAAAHNSLAVMQAMRGDLEEAVRHFREALRIAPEFAEAHAGLARVLTLQGEKEEAVRHYEEALRLLKSERKTSAR